MTLFNRHYSPFFASTEQLMAAKNVHTCSSQNNIFGTMLDSVITGRYEEHGESGEGPALHYSACVLLLLLLVRLLLCGCTMCLADALLRCVCVLCDKQHHIHDIIGPACASPIYRHYSRRHN